MTSSLVGSEMCIRDSTRTITARTAAITAVPPPPADRAAQWNTYVCSVTVSYTHLTLPTICSV
eukprot:1083477-Prorocentrum_lima.AAC.1